MVSNKISHLKYLESESIFIIREAMSEAVRPVLLYSIGKDSTVLLHLAIKAFYPQKIPFSIMHIDTGWKFKEMYHFRDKIMRNNNIDLIVFKNLDGERRNINPNDYNSEIYTDIMKTQALKMALKKFDFDLAFGGARRDEEKSRAKERIFSIRNENQSWDPKSQRPELWDLYNTKIDKKKSIRVFPLSNWTELDIWQYIYEEKIPIVNLYLASKRRVINRDNMFIMVNDNRLNIKKDEKVIYKSVRFRTLGCYPLTSAIVSEANSIESILLELLNTKFSERQGRTIDKDSASSMEKKKLQGYF